MKKKYAINNRFRVIITVIQENCISVFSQTRHSPQHMWRAKIERHSSEIRESRMFRSLRLMGRGERKKEFFEAVGLETFITVFVTSRKPSNGSHRSITHVFLNNKVFYVFFFFSKLISRWRPISNVGFLRALSTTVKTHSRTWCRFDRLCSAHTF